MQRKYIRLYASGVPMPTVFCARADNKSVFGAYEWIIVTYSSIEGRMDFHIRFVKFIFVRFVLFA